MATGFVSALLRIREESDNRPEPNRSIVAKQILQISKSAAVAGISYYLGTRIGFAFTPNGQPNSAFWPPNAILLAVFLLTPKEIWWSVFLTVIPAHLLAQLQAGVPVWTSIGWLGTNVSEALVGAVCITRFVRPTRVFDSVRGVLIFLEFAVLVAPLATSFLDAAAVVLTGWGHGYLPISAERFWTNALAELTIVPSIVLCSVNYVRWIRKAGLPRACEASLLFLCTVLVTFLIFGLHPISAATAPALLYVPILLLLWATARFGSGGLSLSLLLISLTSIWYVTHGHQPFPYASLAQNILSLQILLCVVALPLMFLSAILTEARHTQESLRGITADLIEAQEQERRRIARELHDGLSQQLSLAQVKLSTLIEESNESLKPGLAEVSGELSAVSIEAHEISHGLYPSVLEYLGLARALEKLRDEASAGKLQILLRIGNLPRQLPAAISLCLYRIAQEALRNAIKHSQADHFQLEVGAQSGHIFLRVDDDGVGFDIRGEGTGLGLNSMRQRVRSVGGTIDIRSYWKKGTRIEVRVPFAEHRADNIAGVA